MNALPYQAKQNVFADESDHRLSTGTNSNRQEFVQKQKVRVNACHTNTHARQGGQACVLYIAYCVSCQPCYTL